MAVQNVEHRCSYPKPPGDARRHRDPATGPHPSGRCALPSHARSRIATAEHLRDDLRDLSSQVMAIALPEHLPVIAEDLFKCCFINTCTWELHNGRL